MMDGLKLGVAGVGTVGSGLLRLLAGGAGTAAAGNLPQDTILIARTMGPAELLDYDRQRLRGLVLEEGGATSHVAIVARALGLAAISQAKGALERTHRFVHGNFEAGRRFANQLDFQDQLDRSSVAGGR